MPEAKWKDSTSYKRGDTERKPTTWEIEEGGLRVSVVWNHLYWPGRWVFHCHELSCDTELLPDATDEASAKRQAVVALYKRLERYKAALDKLLYASAHTQSEAPVQDCGCNMCEWARAAKQ